MLLKKKQQTHEKRFIQAFLSFGVVAMSGCKKDDPQPVVPDSADTIVASPTLLVERPAIQAT